MVKLFVPYTYAPINVAGIIQTRINRDYILDEGFGPAIKNAKRVNAKQEAYGLYMTYSNMNIEQVMQIINEPDLIGDYTFECNKLNIDKYLITLK
jgi:hypothetical protein